MLTVEEQVTRNANQGWIVDVCYQTLQILESPSRNRNAGSDTVTTISYNEHGDKSVERETMTENSAVPGFAEYHIDVDGTLTPSIPADEPTELPDRLLSDNEVRYEYEYDSYGNWTQQTENPARPYHVHVRHRKLTYY